VEIAADADAGDEAARASLERYADRMARALATVIDVLDPDVIVLGGGMSNLASIYPVVRERLSRWVFSDYVDVPVLPAVHGDSGGVRGAAWLFG
jgi:fructokinase